MSSDAIGRIQNRYKKATNEMNKGRDEETKLKGVF